MRPRRVQQRDRYLPAVVVHPAPSLSKLCHAVLCRPHTQNSGRHSRLGNLRLFCIAEGVCANVGANGGSSRGHRPATRTLRRAIQHPDRAGSNPRHARRNRAIQDLCGPRWHSRRAVHGPGDPQPPQPMPVDREVRCLISRGALPCQHKVAHRPPDPNGLTLGSSPSLAASLPPGTEYVTIRFSGRRDHGR
jgi:hypothetical protein